MVYGKKIYAPGYTPKGDIALITLINFQQFPDIPSPFKRQNSGQKRPDPREIKRIDFEGLGKCKLTFNTTFVFRIRVRHRPK
jgi:hypothetical protein